MPDYRRRRARARQLSNAEWWELCLGPIEPFATPFFPSAFVSDVEREQAYFAPQVHARNQSRHPVLGWWKYESGIGAQPRGPGVDEGAWLAEHVQLTPVEEAAILAGDRLMPKPAATIIRARRGIPEPSGP